MIPAGVVARERVPEQMVLPEDAEALILIRRKGDVGEEGDERAEDAKRQTRR